MQAQAPHQAPTRIDIRVGISASDPGNLTLFDNSLIFTANPPNTGVPCNGATGTVLGQELLRTVYPFLPFIQVTVKDIFCGSNNSFPRDFTVFQRYKSFLFCG